MNGVLVLRSVLFFNFNRNNDGLLSLISIRKFKKQKKNPNLGFYVFLLSIAKNVSYFLLFK